MTGRALVLRGDAAHIPMPDASVDLIVMMLFDPKAL
jgi:hypothetical protein